MNPKLSLFVALLVVGQIGSSDQKPAEQSTLYVFGGLIDISSGYITNWASRMDSATESWKRLNDLPDPQAKSCGAVVGKKIYLFGGFIGLYNYGNPSGISAATNVYDSLTDTYSMLRSMPEARQSCGAAALKDSIFVAGGSKDRKFEPEVADSSSFSSMIRYDIGANKWSTMKSMSIARNGLQLIELGGLLYVFGGDANKTAEVYNPATDQWSLVASTNYVHRWFGATTHDGKIYAYSTSGFEVYAPDTNQWTVLDTLNGAVFGMRPLVSMNGKLWAIAGAYTFDDLASTKRPYWSWSNALHTYDPATGLWTKEHDMNAFSVDTRKYHTAFVVNY